MVANRPYIIADEQVVGGPLFHDGDGGGRAPSIELHTEGIGCSCCWSVVRTHTAEQRGTQNSYQGPRHRPSKANKSGRGRLDPGASFCPSPAVALHAKRKAPLFFLSFFFFSFLFSFLFFSFLFFFCLRRRGQGRVQTLRAKAKRSQMKGGGRMILRDDANADPNLEERPITRKF